MTVTFCDMADAGIPVARVRLKLRLRYSIEDLIEDWRQRVDVHKIDRTHRKHLDQSLLDSKQTLVVHVKRACGLPPAPRQRPEQLRPYVFYQLPGQQPHFTRTGTGPHTSLDDICRIPIRVDDTFCKWAEQAGGLHIVVFDDAALAASEKGGSGGAAAVDRSLGLLG